MVAKNRLKNAGKALSLNENDPRVLNDLGWTLALADFYDEARAVLERSAALAPAEYELPRNNLKELEKLERSRLATEKERSRGDAPSPSPPPQSS